MYASLESLITLAAFEIANVLVHGPDVGVQAAGLAEILVAVLAADLPADAVLAQVIAQRVSIGVCAVADVAAEGLALVALLVNAEGRAIVEPSGTPIANKTAAVERSGLGFISAVLSVVGSLDIGGDGVSGDVQFEMPPQILAIGEPFEASQANEALCLVVIQLLLRQGQPVLQRYRRRRRPLMF